VITRNDGRPRRDAGGAGGDTIEELLDGYPILKREDIAAALAYGAWLARERILPLAPST
jgi:hypothetical protein